MLLKKCALALAIVSAAAALTLLSRPALARLGLGAAEGPNAGQVESVTITEQGLKPDVVMLRRKIPARLTFVRKTNDTCATEIKAEELGIHVTLPLNEQVSVDITPSRPGKFDFGCGTGKFRGVIVIQ